MERIAIQSFHPRALKTIFPYILTFLRPPCLKSEHKVTFFIFGLEGHRKVFCTLCSSLIISVGTFDINERKTIFENVKVLKTLLLPSRIRRRIRQTFKTFWILDMLSKKCFSFHFSFLYEERILVIFMISLLKSSCHKLPLSTFQHSNTCNFAFFMIWFQSWILWKCSKCIKKVFNPFSPVSHFYIPWKRHKIEDFLTLSGGIEMWHWTKMG